MAIGNKAMLVHLHIRRWTGRKYDKEISTKIEQQYNARKNVGSYRKKLVAGDQIDRIKSAGSAIRKFHYENTLPWEDDGVRMLPSDNYLHYVEKMRELKGSFDMEVNEFLRIYHSLIDEAQVKLGDMFKKDDYPDIDTLKTKYAVEQKIVPVPDASDFRVSLNNDEISAIKEEITKNVTQGTETGMKDLWDRLFKVVEHMVERLSKKSKFNDSLVGNIESLCEILPRLNVTDDQLLTQSVQDVKDRLTAYDPQTLRDNPEIRNQTAEAAQEILDKMKSYQVP